MGALAIATCLIAVIGASPGVPPTRDELCNQPDLLERLYLPAYSLTVQEFIFSPEKGAEVVDTPTESSSSRVEQLYVIRKDSQVLYLPKEAHDRGELTSKSLRKNGVNILCLANYSGGNGWTANPWFVLRLDPLELLGQVSHIRETHEYAGEDLVVVDPVWEPGLLGLDHASSPFAEVILKVGQSGLELDKTETQNLGYVHLRALSAEIEQIRLENKEPIPLGKMLSKFLYYRGMGQVEQGWRVLHEDLLSFEPARYPEARSSSGKKANGLLTIAEVEQAVKESLAAHKNFERELRDYVEEPLQHKSE